MEDCLSRALAFLPQTHKLFGYPILPERMKIGAALLSLTVFMEYAILSYLFFTTKYMRYHHWHSAVAIVQGPVWYSYLALHVLRFVLNIIVFFTMCFEMSVAWGLLFVLVSLLALPVKTVWVVFALVRHWVDPGLHPNYEWNYTKCPEPKDNTSFENLYFNETCGYLAGYSDYDELYYLFLVDIVNVYFTIIIYTYYKDKQKEAQLLYEPQPTKDAPPAQDTAAPPGPQNPA